MEGGGNGETAAATAGGVEVNDFIATGRTGRRNAIADIEEHATTTTAGLPQAMEKLSCGRGEDQYYI